MSRYLKSKFSQFVESHLTVPASVSSKESMQTSEIITILNDRIKYGIKKVFIFSGGLVTLDEYKLIQKLNIPYEYFPVERKFKGDSVTKIGPNTSKKNKIGVTWNIINN